MKKNLIIFPPLYPLQYHPLDLINVNMLMGVYIMHTHTYTHKFIPALSMLIEFFFYKIHFKFIQKLLIRHIMYSKQWGSNCVQYRQDLCIHGALTSHYIIVILQGKCRDMSLHINSCLVFMYYLLIVAKDNNDR